MSPDSLAVLADTVAVATNETVVRWVFASFALAVVVIGAVLGFRTSRSERIAGGGSSNGNGEGPRTGGPNEF